MIGIFILSSNELSMLSQLHITLSSGLLFVYPVFFVWSSHMHPSQYSIGVTFLKFQLKIYLSKNYLTFPVIIILIYTEVAFIRKIKGPHNSNSTRDQTIL